MLAAVLSRQMVSTDAAPSLHVMINLSALSPQLLISSKQLCPQTQHEVPVSN